jgi:anti-anti-sigma factor
MDREDAIRSDRARDVGALNLASTFLASFPPSVRSAQERKLASLARVREHGVLRVLVEQDGKGLLVRPQGELDVASAKTFEDVVREAIDSGVPVLLDLGGVSFIDSTGLRALFSMAAHSRTNGDRLRVLRGSEQVETAIEVSGVARSLPFAD